MSIDGAIHDFSARAARVLQDVVVRGQRSSIPVWLDAICINQEDKNERPEQVSIMKHVYSLANEVLAWVGPDDGMGSDARVAIDAIVRQCRDHVHDLDDPYAPVFRDPHKIQRRVFSYEPLPEDCDWSVVQQFYSAELFSRLWVVQEISLARWPICLIGDQPISWVDIGLAAEWLMHRNYERPEYCGLYIQGVVNCSIISHLRARLHAMDKILIYSTHFRTSEPRDKVFGLLGLIQRETNGNVDDVKNSSISVDYALPTAHIYTMATRTAISMTGRLTILRFPELNTGYAEVRDIVDGCPSWVPQFNATSSIRTKGIRQLGLLGCDDDQKLGIDSSTPPQILRVQGVVVSSVARVLDILTDNVLNDRSRLSTFIHNIYQTLKKQTPHETSLEILYRTLTARDDSLETAGGDQQGLLQSSFATLVHECSRTWPDGLEVSHLAFDPSTPSSIYVEALRITNRYKSYLVTSAMEVGIGCSEATEGDQLCILFGNGMPFLLRPYSDGYKIVNNIYLHSNMDGQYVRNLEASGRLERSRRWFNLY